MPIATVGNHLGLRGCYKLDLIKFEMSSRESQVKILSEQLNV